MAAEFKGKIKGVFHLICEEALKEGDAAYIDTEIIFAKSAALGISDDDFQDVLRILQSAGDIEVPDVNGPLQYVSVSPTSLVTYANHNVPGCEHVLSDVEAAIRDGARTSVDIQTATGQPHVLVLAVLERLSNSQRVTITEPMSSDAAVGIIHVSPALLHGIEDADLQDIYLP
jgi:hypothetical protein